MLALAGVAAAFTSDWFVAAIDPAVEELGISKAFTGLVIVAIAGNAVENVVGVQLAWKRRYDLAISVVKNSVAQIAAFLYPALVLISLLFTQRLTFGVPPGGLVLVVALVFAALAIWQITGDGEAPGVRGARARRDLRRARDRRLVRVAQLGRSPEPQRATGLSIATQASGTPSGMVISSSSSDLNPYAL